MKKIPELGWVEGTFSVPADFDEMPAEELAQWQGDEDDPLREFRSPRSVGHADSSISRENGAVGGQ